jgi:hypothetical protein
MSTPKYPNFGKLPPDFSFFFREKTDNWQNATHGSNANKNGNKSYTQYRKQGME